MPELKFSKSPDAVRKKLLINLLKTDFQFMYFVANKQKIYGDLREKKDKFFNYVTGLLLDHLLKDNPTDIVNLVVDKVKTKKIAVRDFDNYMELKRQISGEQTRLNIQHELSQNDYGLQAVDFVSGAIFRGYERNDWSFYNIIRGRRQFGTVWPK